MLFVLIDSVFVSFFLVIGFSGEGVGEDSGEVFGEDLGELLIK
jgi:hypothetical protein